MGNSRASSLSSIKIQAGRPVECSRCRCPWPYRDIPLALLASLASSYLASPEKPFERPSAVSCEASAASYWTFVPLLLLRLASVEGCLAPRMTVFVSVFVPASVPVLVVVAGRPCLGIGPGLA